MTDTIPFDKLGGENRKLEPAQFDDPELGPFKLLPGTWVNPENSVPRGWNLIALPFPLPVAQPPGGRPGFRLLLNKYSEVLKFNLVDKAVPNRGQGGPPGGTNRVDQLVVTIDYEQSIKQELAADAPESGLAGAPDLAIHHEPGLFLSMSDPFDVGGPDIARLATIPHGDAALALGRSRVIDDFTPDDIPTIDALPIGAPRSLDNPYLGPYKIFHDDFFDGVFDPTDPTRLLKVVAAGLNVVRTTILEFDTTLPDAGINNVPFVVNQANASEMQATFFIHELAETDASGKPKLVLQYAQIVQLDFLPRFDGGAGRIQWPHVSINTLEKQSDVPSMDYAAMEQFPGR
jgi:hypothetical protein